MRFNGMTTVVTAGGSEIGGLWMIHMQKRTSQ
jgi:hypothetical protein